MHLCNQWFHKRIFMMRLVGKVSATDLTLKTLDGLKKIPRVFLTSSAPKISLLQVSPPARAFNVLQLSSGEALYGLAGSQEECNIKSISCHCLRRRLLRLHWEGKWRRGLKGKNYWNNKICDAFQMLGLFFLNLTKTETTINNNSVVHFSLKQIHTLLSSFIDAKNL